MSMKRSDWGIRNHDRTLTGANPGQDQALLHLCYALSEIEKNKTYAQAADAALHWFFKHCQGSTGLMAWGEHCGWDFLSEQRVTQNHNTDGIHEFCNNWELWPRHFRLQPQASHRFAIGLWQHQIADQKTGDFSRHAFIDHHGPGTDSQYPRHGGFYIRAWAEAYQHEQQDVYLDAIRCLVHSFQKRRHPQTRALLAETHPRSKGDRCWTVSSLALAIELEHCSSFVPKDVAALMQQCAAETDRVWCSLAHDLTGRGGFVRSCRASTLEAFDTHKPQKSPYSTLWNMAYGTSNTTGPAYLCLLRYEQTKNKAYYDLGMQAATRYLNGDVDTTQVLWPKTFANLIGLLCKAYRLSGEERFKQRAITIANTAIDLFFETGKALPKASNKHQHYEAITGSPLLVLALLDLDNVIKKRQLQSPLPYDNR